MADESLDTRSRLILQLKNHGITNADSLNAMNYRRDLWRLREIGVGTLRISI